MKKLVAVIAVAVLAAYGAHAEVHAGYILTDLGTLGGTSSYASGINAAGQIVGYAFTSGNAAYHAFLSNGTPGGMTDLGTLGGTYSSASGINAAGQIVGDAYTSGNAAYHAFLSNGTPGGMTNLGTLGGTSSYASGINAAGQIVGYADTSGNAAHHAFLSNATPGGMTDLNSLVISGGSGWELQSATAINDNGQIVGSGMVDGAEHAFLLTESQAVPEPSTLVMWSILLGTLGVVWSYKRLKQPALAA